MDVQHLADHFVYTSIRGKSEECSMNAEQIQGMRQRAHHAALDSSRSGKRVAFLGRLDAWVYNRGSYRASGEIPTILS
jgi:hypothetical protein